MMRSVVTLVLGAALFWGLVAVPARHLLGGELTYVYSGTALLMCLIPGVVTLVWAGWSARHDPQQLPLVVLGATGVRMFGVLIAAWLLVQNVPLYREEGGFLYWLIVCYLFTLALEMYVLLSGRPRPDGSA
jgi:threonine/homoserine/homoserine lactone efflux protein